MKPKFDTIGQIKQGNPRSAHEHTSAFEVATELLHSRYSGMPVVDKNNRVIGVVSEQDLLRALREPRSFEEIKVNDIMTQSPVVIEEKTTLEEASKIMEDSHIHRLPVVKDGVLVGTVNRHDLLRAWLGMSAEL
ncbi:MAG TPA: CBS domain-containing protein [Nitrospiria bacterium]|nr:CBS domain-containing protein [Nitrospiria bacterium]